MEEIWNLVGSDEDPLHHVCNGLENKWSRSKAKGENQVHVELVAPLHPQKKAVRGVYGHIAVGCLHIIFGHEGEFVWINPVIDTRPPGEERSMMRHHFPGWPLLGITPKLLT